MNKIRIGKDFTIRWSLYDREGQPYELAADTLLLRVVSPFGAKVADGALVQGNVVEWTFRGREQKHLGKYALELVERNGEDGMITIDTINAFELVAHTYQESQNEDNAVVVQAVQVDSTTSLIPVPVPTDKEFSETSTNAIANNVVTLEFKSVKERIQVLESESATKAEFAGAEMRINARITNERAALDKAIEENAQAANFAISSLDSKVDTNKKQVDSAIAALNSKLTSEIGAIKKEVKENDAEISELKRLVAMITQSQFFKNNQIGFAYIGFAEIG